MIDKATRITIAAAICCCDLACGVVLGQQSDAKSGAPAPADQSVDEEIIVHGQSPAQLRVQMELAQEAVYDRFNEINSNDEFDIHCRRERVTGSNLLRRICQADFWRDAQAKAGAETARKLQGSYGFDAQQFLAEAEYKRHLMAEEMRRLAAEDKELQRDLVHFETLDKALEASSRQAPPATASAQKSAGEQALPYDAALEADVRMGRKPWSHVLAQRTFTLAHVYGEIDVVEIKCHRHRERLRYETGVEWTLPNDWDACALRVEAPSGTTFSLYEFP